MKRFKSFLQKPVTIKAVPCHGSHASKRIVTESVFGRVPANKYDSWIGQHDNEHLGSGVGEVASKIKHPDLPNVKGFGSVKKYTEFSRGINKELVHSAQGKSHYTSEVYPHLSGEELKSLQRGHKRKVANLDKFIDSHPPLQHEVKVYHGTNAWHPGEESAKHPEGHVHLPAYTSTSLKKNLANRFAGGEGLQSADHGRHILEIHLPKGHKGVYIGTHSHHKDESELLLPRGMNLKIHPEPKVLQHTVHQYSHKTGGYEPKDINVHVWKATPV